MARKIDDYIVTDFRGLVTNASDYEMQKGEFVALQNYDLDERGRLRQRLGSQAYGNELLEQIKYLFSVDYDGTNLFLGFTNSSSSRAHNLFRTNLTASLATGASTASVANATSFTASGTFEVNGDIVTYTSKAGVPTTTLNITGSTVLKTHSQGSPVHQWSIGIESFLDSRMGAYYVNQAGIAAFFGNGQAKRINSASPLTFAALTKEDGLNATIYRSRCYVSGSGGSTVNSQSNRISWSNPNDITTWDDDDNFYVHEDGANNITALKTYKDRLIIFKHGYVYTWDEVQLKKRLEYVGAYNQLVVQEIDGLLYTTSASGVHVTNGITAQRISDPVKKYLDMFYPEYDEVRGLVVTNISSFQHDKKYYLVLPLLQYPNPDATEVTLRKVILCYDTVTKTWATDVMELPQGISESVNCSLSVPSFYDGNSASLSGYIQPIEASFFATDYLFVYRLFSNRAKTTDARGGDLHADSINNSLGIPISAFAETPFLHFGYPSWWKRYGYLRLLIEEGSFNVSYRLDKGTHYSEWMSLGEFTNKNDRKKFPETDGLRIALKITSISKDARPTLNGFMIEENEAISRQSRK